MTASIPLLRRRGALAWALAALLAGCDAEAPPPTFAPLRFDFLPKLRLNVATIDVDNAWQPETVPDGTHVEALAPTHPVDALKRMAQDRLLPAGASGHAILTIVKASLVQRAGQYEGAFAVHLDLSTADGSQSGEANASVNGTRTIPEDSPDAARVALYELVKRMMSDMNAELEFQLRKSLHDFLQTGTDTQPPAEPVQMQELPGDAAKPAQ